MEHLPVALSGRALEERDPQARDDLTLAGETEALLEVGRSRGRRPAAGTYIEDQAVDGRTRGTQACRRPSGYRPGPMRVGVAKEIKPQEYRVALTPAGALELVRRGHEVVVETGAGVGSGFADEAYVAVGARTAPVEEVWSDRSCCSR